MIRRATILMLATVVSLCATQPAPMRASKSQDIPAIIWLAESRAEKAVKLKVECPQFPTRSSTRHFAGEFSSHPQTLSAAIAPRAPPALPV